MYIKYHRQFFKRITLLNNREFFILFGVIIGSIVGIDGIFFNNFTNAPILGFAKEHGIFFKIGMIILSGGTFGNLLSYVGSALDIISNHNNIILLLIKWIIRKIKNE